MNPFHLQACGVGSSIETAHCCDYSFAATPGWDASTGLGSPNFQVLANLVLNNESYFPSVAAYPSGVASVNTYTTTDSSDDDVVNDQALSGVILGAVGTTLAIIALVYACFFAKSGGKSNTLI